MIDSQWKAQLIYQELNSHRTAPRVGHICCYSAAQHIRAPSRRERAYSLPTADYACCCRRPTGRWRHRSSALIAHASLVTATPPPTAPSTHSFLCRELVTATINASVVATWRLDVYLWGLIWLSGAVAASNSKNGRDGQTNRRTYRMLPVTASDSIVSQCWAGIASLNWVIKYNIYIGDIKRRRLSLEWYIHGITL